MAIEEFGYIAVKHRAADYRDLAIAIKHEVLERNHLNYP